jgi:hypothetical protein
MRKRSIGLKVMVEHSGFQVDDVDTDLIGNRKRWRMASNRLKSMENDFICVCVRLSS